MAVIMNFGYIPKDWDVERERICVGDANNSGTTELLLIWEDGEDFMRLESLGERIQIDQSLYEESSVVWTQLISILQKHFGDVAKSVSAATLCRAFNFFNEEDDNLEGLEFVAGSKDGGEFRNDECQYNGKFFIHYVREDGEYFDERVVIIL